jgi:hypothetical protein
MSGLRPDFSADATVIPSGRVLNIVRRQPPWGDSEWFLWPRQAGRILLGQYMESGVRQFTLNAATMSLATGHSFFLNDIAVTVDMQFDATGRLYILTINALYRVDLGTF